MVALLMTGMVTGCATAVPVVDFYDTDSDTLRRFQDIVVLGDTSADAKSLGEVEGIYCKKTPGQASVDDPLAKAQAIDQVKLKAAAKGANYVTAPQCIVNNSGDVANNCYSTVVCTAAALRVTN
jgi:hypothetical protein